MAEDNKMKRCPVTLQPDIEELLDNLIAADQAAKLAKMNEAN